MLTREILERTRRDGDVLAAIETQLDRLESKLDGINQKLDRLGEKDRPTRQEPA
jgi:hypothetical protein